MVLKLVTSASGDWTIAYLNSSRFTEGHSGWTPLLADLCEQLNIEVVQEEVPDKIMEELCYGSAGE